MERRMEATEEVSVESLQALLDDEKRAHQDLRGLVERLDNALARIDRSTWTIEKEDHETYTEFMVRGVIASDKFFSGQVKGLLEYVAALEEEVEEKIGEGRPHEIRSALTGEEVLMYDAKGIMDRIDEVSNNLGDRVETVESETEETKERAKEAYEKAEEFEGRIDDIENDVSQIEIGDIEDRLERAEQDLEDRVTPDMIDELEVKVRDLLKRVTKVLPETGEETKLKADLAAMLATRKEDESDEVLVARMLAIVRREDGAAE
jgi:hypothetical protein